MRGKKYLATLQFGKILSNNFIAFLYVVLSLSLPLIVLCVITIIQDNDLMMIIMILFVLSVMAAIIYVLVNQKRHLKYVKEWLKDAVVVEAEMYQISPISRSTEYTDYAFQITFIYEDETITIVRDTSVDKRLDTKVYQNMKCITKFPTKLQILYSPKYNQVIFYKDLPIFRIRKR